MKIYQFVVKSTEAGQRLDGFLSAKIGTFSKRKVKAMVDSGQVDVNGRRQKIASYVTQPGDKIRLYDPELSEGIDNKYSKSPLSPNDILAQTDNYIVLSKPPGLASQQTKDPRMPHVISALGELFRAEKRPLKEPLILVHRLDLETSGVIFVAKNPACATWVTDLFRQRLAKKKYLAICQCISLRKHFSEIAALSEIDKKTGNVRVVKSGGRQAETEFVMLKENEACGASLFECRPKTGRSHQIRVHLDHNGLPILGDKRYGQAKRRLLPTAYLKVTDLATIGHCLHAFELKLAPMPNEPVQTFKALPPPHFAEIVQILFPD